MALSNWDTLAVDQTGTPAPNGVFVSPLGVRIEFYKNWIYVQDEHAWEPGCYMRPTVMEIASGDIVYKDVHIFAVRGPQNGIYAVVWSRSGKPDHVTAMLGCGVSGYTNDGEWVGVTAESCAWWQAQLSESHPVWTGFDTVSDKFCEHATQAAATACSVAEHSRDAEFVVVPFPGDFPDELRALAFSNATRFNQGDAYFARHLDAQVPSTPVGAAAPPLLMGILKGESDQT